MGSHSLTFSTQCSLSLSLSHLLFNAFTFACKKFGLIGSNESIETITDSVFHCAFQLNLYCAIETIGHCFHAELYNCLSFNQSNSFSLSLSLSITLSLYFTSSLYFSLSHSLSIILSLYLSSSLSPSVPFSL